MIVQRFFEMFPHRFVGNFFPLSSLIVNAMVVSY